jgi:hypothetical protein
MTASNQSSAISSSSTGTNKSAGFGGSRNSSHLTLRLTRTWNVRMPPAKKKTLVGGVMTPTLSLPIAKKRRVAIEIYSPSSIIDDQELDEDVDDDDDDPIITPRDSRNRPRNPAPIARGLTRSNASRDNDLIDLCAELREDDWILVRILKPRRGRWGFSKDDSDSDDSEEEVQEQQAHHGEHDKEQGISLLLKVKTASKWIKDTIQTTAAENSPSHMWMQHQQQEADDEWMEYRRYNLEAIVDEELRDHYVFEAMFGLASRERRDIKFESEEAALGFHRRR